MPKRKGDNAITPTASKKQKFNCDICLTSHPNSDMIATCVKHRFCKDSISRYVSHKIDDGEHIIPCPGLQCEHRIRTPHIKLVTDTSTFKKFKVLNMPITTAKISECPQCDNSTRVKRNQKEVTCAKCQVIYCVLHGIAHSGRSCAEYVQDQSYQASIDTIVEMTQLCPQCEAPSVKISGCQNMTCARCHAVSLIKC